MSPEAAQKGRGAPRFPRVSGDDPYDETTTEPVDLFSPRERG